LRELSGRRMAWERRAVVRVMRMRSGLMKLRSARLVARRWAARAAQVVRLGRMGKRKRVSLCGNIE
jgi:hypothetical protein